MQENHDFFAHSWRAGGRDGLRLSAPISPNIDSATDSSWAHFAPFGPWKGHPDGPFNLTRKVFESIVDRFEKTINDVPLDYNHNMIKEGFTGDAIAAGWIKALEIRGDGSKKGDGLWAFVEWTKKAATHIRNKEFKFTSPFIDFKSTDRKSGAEIGPELINTALTNLPFLDGQVPLALERFTMDIHINNGPKGADAPKVDKAKTESAPAAAMQDEGMGGGIIDKIAEAAGLEPAAVEAALMDKLDEVIALVVGAQSSEGTPAEEAATSVPAAAVASDRWTRVEKEQLKALTNKVKELTEKDEAETTKRILDRVAEKIDGGYILDGLREDALAMYRENWDRAEKIFETKVVPIGVRPMDNTRKGSSSVQLSADEDRAVSALVSAGYKRQIAMDRIVGRRGN